MTGRWLCIALCSVSTALEAQSATLPLGALAGVVRDSAGAALPAASLQIAALDTVVVTDDSGRFHVAGLPAHDLDISVVRLGYQPVSFAVGILPDTTIVVTVRMRRVQLLDEVAVSAPARTQRFLATGFEWRRQRGLGTFISPERVDSLADAITYASQLLRDARGIELRKSRDGYAITPRRDPKCLWLFVNGTYLHTDQMDVHVAANQVYAIELYDRPSLVPAEFQGRLPAKGSGLTVAGGCGALVVWTKGRQ